MNQLITLNQNTITMTSLEIVDFINNYRKETDESPSVLRHSDFIAKVPKVLGLETSEKFRSSYLAKNGENRPCYSFPKREACLMAMSYSYELQAIIYDRMTELENQLKEQNTPSYQIEDPVKRAIKWIEEYKEKEILLLENQSQKQQLLEQVPKVDFANKVATSENALDFKTVAKFFGTGRNKLFKLCRDEGYLMQDNLPYQKYTENNWFTTVEIVITRQDRTFTKSKTLITGTGQLELQKRHFSHIPVQVIYDENMRIALEEESDE